MKYDRITTSTLSILRKLPLDLSTQSVAIAYHIDPAIVERERPKHTKHGRPSHYTPDDGIPSDNGHRVMMANGSIALRDAIHAAFYKRHWADPHGWGAVYCGMRP